MSNPRPWHSRTRTGAAIATLLLAVTAAGAGMAELGRKKNLVLASAPESDTDTAAGDGPIDLIVGNEHFVLHPTAGTTVSTILGSFATLINGQSPQRYSASVAGAVITVVRTSGAGDVNQFGMVNEDSGFGFVEATHSAGALFLLAVCDTPAGDGMVQVRNGASVLATVTTSGLSAEDVNNALATQLHGRLVGSCSEGSSSDKRRRIVLSGNFTQVSWEDNDTGIKRIGVLNNLGRGIPTLTEWGAILMMAVLAAAALLYLRRRLPALNR